jgi:hypothetical protein
MQTSRKKSSTRSTKTVKSKDVSLQLARFKAMARELGVDDAAPDALDRAFGRLDTRKKPDEYKRKVRDK